MGPEAKIERTLCEEAVDNGWLAWKLTFIGIRGAPDRMFGKGGRTVLIEFKRPGQAATIQQMKRHTELRIAFGFDVYVCDSLERGRKILNLPGV